MQLPSQRNFSRGQYFLCSIHSHSAQSRCTGKTGAAAMQFAAFERCQGSMIYIDDVLVDGEFRVMSDIENDHGWNARDWCCGVALEDNTFLRLPCRVKPMVKPIASLVKLGRECRGHRSLQRHGRLHESKSVTHQPPAVATLKDGRKEISLDLLPASRELLSCAYNQIPH